MRPELFLMQQDVIPLIESLITFAIMFGNASDRLTVLQNANIDKAFLSSLNLSDEPRKFAQQLVSRFRTYRVSNNKLDYHPMIKLLTHLCEIAPNYNELINDVPLFSRLAQQGQENLKALVARNSVASIIMDSPKGSHIGTGVLIRKSWLLTCNHIFSKSQAKTAWARFNYIEGSHNLDSDVFELDLATLIRSSQLDYAVARVKNVPQQQNVTASDALLDSGQKIRLIHHPQGQHAVISELGEIVQVGADYIDHNISTEDGSSGAPIFNCDWQLVAIHRGNLGIGVGRSQEPGTTSGFPVCAFWQNIQTQLF
ncbi:MAG: trypsin-like peptidase domain-containing protein [Nostoc sp. ChiSLP02]|nr:trypsin-like peptidase domain-containing protein [Nostoc sp. DedSLP05]MDZ8098471.1 trypsin-like peptidase domain-containing protein [Nostoc sp. DedSLP01]MDZ8186521.1 trypsin-like peptidase domain-containing protein [Nostoc sp. ChiSLP02]